jgi:arylsulfatase A-like enzyme
MLVLSSGARAAEKPNIVYILADDLGYGDPRCYNAESKIPTPNIDRLAGEGIRFTDAHSGSSVCTPTRYGILTGRYCWRTSLQRGVLGGFSPPLIEPDRLTVAAMLKRQGYATAAFGKWHLGLGWSKPRDKAGDEGADFSAPFTRGPLEVGFDYFFGISASLDMPPYVFLENDRPVADPVGRQEKKGAVRAGPKDPALNFSDVLPALTRKTVEYLDARGKEPSKPFFIYMPLNAPHTPVAPADFAKGKSQAGEYGDFVWEVDWAVGEVLAALERDHLADKTLVIITSDNGSTNLPLTQFGHLPNGHQRGRKSDIWDGGHRIPFIARWPGHIKPGTTSDQTTCLTDLMATTAAIVGVELPKNAAEDSYNILPALLGEAKEPIRDSTVHHSIDGMFAIRQGSWKLVLGRGSGGWDGKGDPADPAGQLYDLSIDPEEKNNLYSSQPDQVTRLTAVLEKCKADGYSRPGAIGTSSESNPKRIGIPE